MKRLGLGGLFFVWLYGVPFLLVVGLIRRTSKPYAPTREAAQAFGAGTDAVLIAALLLNALPIVGLWLAGDADWSRHFRWAVGGMVMVYLMVVLVGRMATGVLIGHTPADDEPAPAVTQCIPRSGGRGCPGG
ncbi:hypothetical protein GCM10028790_21510 [Micromonospora taraxaci]|uniref:Uncharacterized protein n=1 Tax=Micromonospora taraxaci TaxID=1316803 RepID=A0A561VWI3_9ACTN|nr:hypothetical protein [Micromonospora taraxaci]TWG15975.1 hypothetical protein FHU34_111300 [Micromonospora taraxaci]